MYLFPSTMPSEGIIESWDGLEGTIRTTDGDYSGEIVKFNSIRLHVDFSKSAIAVGKKVTFTTGFFFRTGWSNSVDEVKLIDPKVELRKKVHEAEKQLDFLHCSFAHTSVFNLLRRRKLLQDKRMLEKETLCFKNELSELEKL